MKYFDEEEYYREQRAAKRQFWSTIVLIGLGTVIGLATLGRYERKRKMDQIAHEKSPMDHIE